MFLIHSQVSSLSCFRLCSHSTCFIERHSLIDSNSRRSYLLYARRRRGSFRTFSVWLLSKDNDSDPSALNGTKDLANEYNSPVKKPTLLDSAVENSRQQRSTLEALSNGYLDRGVEGDEEEEERTSFRQFMGELWEELRQVEWPTLKQAIQELVVLSVGISVVAVLIYLVDAVFSYVAAILYVK